MKETKYTYCRICEPACGLAVTVEDGQLTEVHGDPHHPLSRGYICPRGRATLHIHRDPDRLSRPLKKADGKWEPVSWETALAEIGGRLKEIRRQHGPHAVALYFGNPLAFDFAFGLYLPFALQLLRSRNIFSSGSQDCNNKFAASEKLFGSPLLHPIPDLDRIEFLILWGSNPAISHMSFMSVPRPIERLQEIIRRAGRVIIIDPRRTETVRLVGEHLFIRPDTDIFLLLALLQVIISENLYDPDTVRHHTRGFEDLARLADRFPPDKAERVTGIPADVISALARDFARAKSAAIHGSLGVNLGSQGTLCAWLIQALNTITGRLDRPGSLLFSEGPVDLARLYFWRTRNHRRRLSRIGGFEAVLGTLPAGIMADEILTPGAEQVRALIVASGNPLLTVPDPDRLEAALKSLDLLVSLDFYLNETGALGHYVLPCKDMFERWDFAMTSLIFNPTRFANFTEPVVQAEGERRDTWLVMKDILTAAGYPEERGRFSASLTRRLDQLAELVRMSEPLSFPPRLLLRAMLAVSDISWKKLKTSPHGLLLPPHRTGQFFAKRILTPDKKVDLAPASFLAEAEKLEDFYQRELEYHGFKLIGQRQRRTHNSWFHNVEELVAKEQTNRLLINPADAARLEIAEGEMVEAANETGRICLPAVLSEEVMPGVICIPHGWGHDKESGLSVARRYPGVNVNKLIASGPEALEKMVGMARMTGVRVEVKKAEE